MSKFTFAIKTPEDLLGKMVRELDRLTEAVLSKDEVAASDAAINCAITGWAMGDWIFASGHAAASGFERSSFKKALQREPCIELCSDLANGMKHFQSKPTDKVAATRAGSEFLHSGVLRSPLRSPIRPVLRSPLENSSGQFRFVVKVTKEAGGQVDADVLFKDVVDFWRALLDSDKPYTPSASS